MYVEFYRTEKGRVLMSPYTQAMLILAGQKQHDKMLTKIHKQQIYLCKLGK